jgi:hypothetical protein
MLQQENKENYIMNDFRNEYTFSCLHKDSDDQKVTFNFKADYLDDVIRNFQDFLVGCGFQINGSLQLLSDEEINPLYHTGEKYTVDNFDFSNIPNNNWLFGQHNSETRNQMQASEK